MVPVLAHFDRELADERKQLEGVEADVRLTMPVIEGISRCGPPSIGKLTARAQRATELAKKMRQVRNVSPAEFFSGMCLVLDIQLIFFNGAN